MLNYFDKYMNETLVDN